MRLPNAIREFVKKHLNLAPNAREAKPHYSWPQTALTAVIYRVADVAEHLSEKVPFFKMKSGGTFAIAIKRNRKGVMAPANFIRVDKDRRPWRERKQMRRKARALAEATA